MEGKFFTFLLEKCGGEALRNEMRVFTLILSFSLPLSLSEKFRKNEKKKFWYCSNAPLKLKHIHVRGLLRLGSIRQNYFKRKLNMTCMKKNLNLMMETFESENECEKKKSFLCSDLVSTMHL